jgi:hypothetical protein
MMLDFAPDLGFCGLAEFVRDALAIADEANFGKYQWGGRGLLTSPRAVPNPLFLPG